MGLPGWKLTALATAASSSVEQIRVYVGRTSRAAHYVLTWTTVHARSEPAIRMSLEIRVRHSAEAQPSCFYVDASVA